MDNMLGDEAEPIPLVRRRSQLTERWFDSPSLLGSSSSHEVIDPPPFRAPALRSVAAGLVTGAVAGFGLITSASLVALAFDRGANVPRALGTWISGAVLQDELAIGAGFGVAMIAGAVFAVLLALGTRHLRRGLPLLLFGAIFVPVLWLAIDVLVLRRYAPGHQGELPLGAMVVGAAVFGACFALLPKLRDRAGGTIRKPSHA